MVRQIYYLRRNEYHSARQCVDDLFRKHRCSLHPKTLIAFERGSRDFDDYTERKLAELFNVSVGDLKSDDGIPWREVRC